MNLKSVYITYIFLLISAFVNKVEAQENQDPLDDYLEMAAKNNPELKSIFNSYLAVWERIPQARALPDPTVMFSIFTSPVETRVGAQNAGISLSQAFPWFGQ